jgi:hypothetical protein
LDLLTLANGSVAQFALKARYHNAEPLSQEGNDMSKLEEFVNRQKEGAKFVITSAMLRLGTKEFDLLAHDWIENGGPGFEISGVPFRKCIDGEFFIDRVTVIKVAAAR